MKNTNDYEIPLMNNYFPKVKRDYPIPERENLLLAFEHKRPVWMPNFEGDSQIACNGTAMPGGFTEDKEVRTNFLGIPFCYSEAQKSATPCGAVLSEVINWEKELVLPDIESLGLKENAAGYVRDENLVVGGHLDSACFEQLHMLEGFEQALIDLITEPAACRNLFEALVDFELNIFKKQHSLYNFDYILYHDDWGTQRGPFFSIDLFKEAILPPTIRLAKGIKAQGVKLVFHNCGLIDNFIPFLVEDIGADGLQIQTINNIEHIISTYGDRVTVEYRRPDPYLLFNPNTTLDQVRDLARTVVDTYGAHTNPGSGAVCTINAPNEEVYYAFDEEMVKYSLEKYK